MTRVPTPRDIGPWDLAAATLNDASSAVVGVEVLPRTSRVHSAYELHSVRATWSEDGTGDLMALAMADGNVPTGVTNADQALMALRHETPIGGGPDQPNVWWHWGRSNQLGAGTGDGTIYLPPEFYWDGELWGIMQNGSGSAPSGLWTVTFRRVAWTQRDFLTIKGRLAPDASKKTGVAF